MWQGAGSSRGLQRWSLWGGAGPTLRQFQPAPVAAPQGGGGISLQPVERPGCSEEHVGSFWSHLHSSWIGWLELCGWMLESLPRAIWSWAVVVWSLMLLTWYGCEPSLWASFPSCGTIKIWERTQETQAQGNEIGCERLRSGTAFSWSVNLFSFSG